MEVGKFYVFGASVPGSVVYLCEHVTPRGGAVVSWASTVRDKTVISEAFVAATSQTGYIEVPMPT